MDPVSPEAKELSSRMAHLLASSGLDAAALSECAGLARSHFGQIMRGTISDPRGSALARVAAATGCSLDWLIRGVGPKPTAESIRGSVDAALEQRAKTAESATPEQPTDQPAAQ